MLTLRKDLRVGLVVGGICVAVVVVYGLLSTLAGSGTEGEPDAGATLALAEPTAPVRTAGETSRTTPAPTASTADATRREATSPANPAPVLASGPTEDPWSAAFATGAIRPEMSATQNPIDASLGAQRPAGAGNPITQPETARTAIDSINREINNVDNTPEFQGPNFGPLNSAAANPARSAPTSGGAPVAAEPGTYTIQPGDTLSSIALDQYGQASLYRLLAEANPSIDPNRLKPGTKIKVPPVQKATPPAADDTADLPTAVDPTKQYTIQVGDSLHAIAARLYGTSNDWKLIYDANRDRIGADPARLKVGMVLSLPKPPTQQ